MEQVPEIRLFGTSQSWKHNLQIFNKQYSVNQSSTIQRRHPQNFAYDSQPSFQRSFQRGNLSVGRSDKPSQFNYYQNAINICEQNQVLNKIKGQDRGALHVSYLTINHKGHKNKKICTLCEAQAISNNLNQCKEQNTANHWNGNQQQNEMTNKKLTQQKFFPGFKVNQLQLNPFERFKRIDDQNDKFKNSDEDKSLSNRQNFMFLEDVPVEMRKTSSKVVSFKEITNLQTENQQHRKYGLRINQPNTGLCEKTLDKRILQSRCESLLNKQDFYPQASRENQDVAAPIFPIFSQSKRQSLNNNMNSTHKLKRSFPQAKLFSQIEQLLFELKEFDEDYETSLMLKELEEITEKDLCRRRSCIETLDSILDKYGTSQQGISGRYQIKPLQLDSWGYSSRHSHNICSPSSKRRSRIFE